VTAELFAGDVKITADKTQNALLVQAGGADFLAIQRLIARLDRPRRQVFVEAVILEVNLSDDKQFGVAGHRLLPISYKGQDAVLPLVSKPGSLSSFSVSSILTLGGFLTGFAGPESSELASLGLPGIPSLGVLVQALQKSSDVNVISTPHLLASDNEESEITVGQNVPFQAGIVPTGLQNLLSGGGANTSSAANLLGSISSNIAPIQRQNVELRVKIKPQINEGGNVRLTLDVQNEEIADRDPVLGPTTSKRSVKSQIVAKDQSTIVIGGLIQERNIRSVAKIPFLGSLPLVGWLFRETNNTKSKTNLLIFLTPYIIRDESDYRRIYERKQKEQQEFVEQFYGHQPKFAVDIDYTRKAGPYARIRAGVEEESLKIENGGAGGPGEGLVTPPGAPRTPARPGEVPNGGQGEPPSGEAAEPPPSPDVERLEVQPRPPTPTPTPAPTPGQREPAAEQPQTPQTPPPPQDRPPE
jgi:general secretion pathway protein D